MKQSITCSRFISFLRTFAGLATCLVGLAAVTPSIAQPLLHGYQVFIQPLGPTFTPAAHVGDLVTVSIRIQNEDEFLDSITITNVTHWVRHSTGAIFSNNLLSAPITLQSPFLFDPTDTVDIITSYLVLPGDRDYLLDYVDVQGTDNFDGLNGTHVPGAFRAVVGGEIQVLAPALNLRMEGAKSSAFPAIAYSGSLSNNGNCSLSDVVVSNLVDGSFSYVMGPTKLSPGERIVFQMGAHAGSPTLYAWGTDELALTVSASVPAPPYLQVAREAGGSVSLTWNTIPGRAYQVQCTANLDRASWTNLGASITAVTDSTKTLDLNPTDPHRFYRVMVLP